MTVVKRIAPKTLCIGCGICTSVCQTEAITILRDELKGQFLPVIDESKCSGCGDCRKVCPGLSEEYGQMSIKIFGKAPSDKLLGSYKKCYVGYAADSSIRYNASSGGIITALLLYLAREKLIKGALVTRMSLKDTPIPFIATQKEEILSAMGSKYCPVPAGIALKTIIKREGPYAIVGLPCFIRGVRKYEQMNNVFKQKIFCRIGLFCGGVENFLGTRFVIGRLGLKWDNVVGIKYRGGGWPGKVSVLLRDGRKKTIPYQEFWRYTAAFFLLHRCTLCSDATAKMADISCGDAWLPELKHEKIGVSIVIARSERGESILKGAMKAGFIKISPISRSLVVKSQLESLRFRKYQVPANRKFNKFIRLPIPRYDSEIPAAALTSYINALAMYFGMFLARWRLWKLLRFVILLRARLSS